MVRIAGIDRDISPLELMWHQSDPQDKLQLAFNFIIEVAAQTVDGKMGIEVEDGTKYTIQVTKEQK